MANYWKNTFKVFDQYSEPMTLYEVGDYIKFYSIDETTYNQIESEINDGRFNKEKWVTRSGH